MLMSADSMEHENAWKPSGAGAPAATSDGVGSAGDFQGRSRAACGRDAVQCDQVVEGLREAKRGGHTGHCSSRSDAQVERSAAAMAGAAAPEGREGRWLSDRPVDVPAHRRGDRTALRCSLSRGPHSPIDGVARLDVSEARTSSHRARRVGHCAMGREGLAAHKKTPRDAEHTSFCSMRPDFSCIRRSGGPGRRADRRPFFTSAAEAIKRSPASRPFRFLRGDGDWVCTPIGTRMPTSARRRSLPSWQPCFATCADTSSWCGIGSTPIAPERCRARA